MSASNNGSQVYYDDVPARPPPRTESGILKWMRENLFKTTLDTFLTIGGIILIIATISGFLLWAVRDANWYAIIFNFRQYMVGRYEPTLEWRVSITALVVLFAAGMAVRVWINQLARTALVTIVALLVLLWVVPPLIINNIPVPSTYLTAGETAITAGTADETPIDTVSFLALEGETVSLTLVEQPVESEATVADLHGFMDVPANTLRNNAIERLDLIERQNTLETQLAQDAEQTIPLFTEAQRVEVEEELADIEIPPPVLENYNINRLDVEITLSTREGEPLSEPAVLSALGDSVSFEIPADGWYVLEKRPETEGTEGIALLAADGIYPILQSTSFVNEQVLPDGTRFENEFVETFVRMLDNYRTVVPVPEIDGEESEFLVVTRNQYRGDREFEHYLRLYVAPFLSRISEGTTLLIVFGVAGYLLTLALQRGQSQQQATRWTSYMFVALPFFIWIMVAGISVREVFSLALVAAAVLYVVFMFYMGKTYGRTLITLVALLVGSAIIIGVQPLTFEGSYGIGLPPLINLLVIFPAALAVMAGSAQFGTVTVDEMRPRLIVFGALTAAFVVVPPLLALTNIIDLNGEFQNWVLEVSDKRNWGGLLLTMMLTIFGIIVAFPIGVLMALGRRSDLPAIKIFATLYIELIRGSPFIVVLFMMQLMIPLLSQDLANIPNTIRALIAVIMFSSAYLAENVRGGFQALPPGQVEAARAVGLQAWQITAFITLPQALRIVIPALVGQFISLFKDTSLVAIVGLIDLTGFVNTMAIQTEFIGSRLEGLVFITIIYFLFSYIMGYVSRLLEASGAGAMRRI